MMLGGECSPGDVGCIPGWKCGGVECEKSFRDRGIISTGVPAWKLPSGDCFSRFLHFALRFWNQTCFERINNK